MSAQRSHNREAGFTLLELLISLTLLGFLMLVVLVGLRFGARAWEGNEAQATATDDVRLAQALLRNELARIYPFFVFDQADVKDQHVDFDGAADSISFLAPAPDMLADAGRARITLKLAEQGGRIALVFSARPELASSTSPYSEILVEGLKVLDFSYFGSERPGETPSWHDRWAKEMQLPQLIRVHAVFADRDPRTWPEFVVAPQISVDVSCVYDPLTAYCQGRK